MKAVGEGEEFFCFPFFFFFFFLALCITFGFFCHQHRRRTKRLSAFGFFINNYPFTRTTVFGRRRGWIAVQGERTFKPILQMHLVTRIHVCFSSLPLLQPGRQSTDCNVLKSSGDELMINKCKLKFPLGMGFFFLRDWLLPKLVW